MKVLSIDVGIKNLAFCLLEKKPLDPPAILAWDAVNLTQSFESKCADEDKGTVCGKVAKFSKNGKCFCLKHAKKQHHLQIPTNQLKPAFIAKQKINVLSQIADDYKIKYTQPCKKADLVSAINEYIYNACFEPVATANASKIDLVTVGRNIQTHFDVLLADHLESIDTVVIENQISPIANRMKTVQGMISQYFIMKNHHLEIEFVSAKNKLKDSPGSSSKMSYSERKKLGVTSSLDFLEQHNYQLWAEVFNKHAKKDDLADALLQGVWFVGKK
jgi:hypothetical protein